LSSIFGFTSTPTKPMIYKELSFGFIVDWGIPHQFRMIITFIKDRKGIQQDYKSFYCQLFRSIFCFSLTPIQTMTYKELSFFCRLGYSTSI
jgi:hypothetical protein